MVSKVQSLKLDTSVWSNEIVQVSQDVLKLLVQLIDSMPFFLSVSCSSCWGTIGPTSSGQPG